MSDENIEIARRAYAAYSQGGVEAILDFLDPEIEWRMWERFAREPRTYRGHEGVREVLSVFEENFDDFNAEPSEFIEAGDRIIVPVTLRGRAKGTGEEATFKLVHAWTVRGDLAGQLDVYESKEAALRAAGIDDATSGTVGSSS